ncbi:F0F1 ATP synthase subunit gamma [Parenemella sanctibonifatiensis]|uniref:ATP synthase gamma chain n=1 Tax=Parenemella sanctibonifatiensis TaxID=2016505 RepID=A0A255EHE9_9ACTN|nr:F0F1 ATP synthase subunit gamma [Parenemella sanctibonifatiensis]OYN90956.1 F0F1 ATP synthase subunit gamma [Parenemella sanctibonifatiensis]
MAASLRELRSRRRSVASTQKITRAMELIAASRIIKAQGQARAAAPYANELTKAVSEVASSTDIDHPLTTEVENPRRAAMLVITSDRGQAGAYTANAVKTAEGLRQHLLEEDKEIDLYLTGRKGKAYYDFRNREIAQSWTGFSEAPSYEEAYAIAVQLLDTFSRETEEGGVDEIHVVFTRFVSMINQRPEAFRLLPLEVVEDDAEGTEQGGEYRPLFTFEPDAETVLDELLPLYVASRIHYCLLQAAASELASRQRAMKAATDNAEEIIQQLTREANQARQAGITQEITEIVGGASALAESGSE